MTGDILVLNAGSSSLKLAVFAASADGPVRVRSGAIDDVGTARSHADALAALLKDVPTTPAAVGHRVVHGGMRYAAPVRLDAAVRAELEALVPLAPLHQPANLAGIDAAAAAFPGVPQVACFDTAFHRGKPFVADAFALPRELYEQGVRRYGFHGLSYEYIARELRRVAPEVAGGRVVVCHLGNGASLCGLCEGRCVETTMSFTALDGLAMGTRCGLLDPGAVLYLMEGRSIPELTELLYHRSGLLGLSGVSSDMRVLLASADPRAAEAIDYFVHRVVCGVGSLAGALGGLDAVVFTAGIGEHAAAVRERVCRRLGWLGVELDADANARHAARVTTAGSRVSAWVVPTDEERMIALHVAEVVSKPEARAEGQA